MVVSLWAILPTHHIFDVLAADVSVCALVHLQLLLLARPVRVWSGCDGPEILAIHLILVCLQRLSNCCLNTAMSTGYNKVNAISILQMPKIYGSTAVITWLCRAIAGAGGICEKMWTEATEAK